MNGNALAHQAVESLRGDFNVVGAYRHADEREESGLIARGGAYHTRSFIGDGDGRFGNDSAGGIVYGAGERCRVALRGGRGAAQH